jgi:outer membrane protein assembly factor BamD (BamD/ComL family)
MKTLAAVLALVVIATLPIVAMTEADNEKDDELYLKASKALDEQRWIAAIAGFRQIVNAKGPRTDRAMYWLAHAQFKGGRASDALATLQDLRGRYPKSDWIDDAEAMEIEIRNSTGQPVAPEGLDDEELKMIAITSLMGTDPDRAIALLEKILAAKKSSDAMQERALFVLGQLHSPRAQQMLESYARNGADPERQREAIKAMAISGHKRDGLMTEIYRSTTNRETKEAILEGLMISNNRTQLLQIAESEPDASLRGQAAQKLGVMRAAADLQRLYAKETSRDVKDSILQGMFIAGDIEGLSRLARSEPDAQLRKNAIRSLGMIGGKRSWDVLMEIWNAPNATLSEKEGVLEALFIRGDASTLIAFARKETNRQLKRELVQRIALMHTKEAREYMQELLDK